jgi:hypothetical protein
MRDHALRHIAAYEHTLLIPTTCLLRFESESSVT